MQWGKILRVLGMFGFVAILAMSLASAALAGGVNASCLGRGLSFDSVMRWSIEDRSLLFDVKDQGGYCTIDWGQAMKMTIDSSQGTIKVDGVQQPNGRDVRATGRRLEIWYDRGNQSNGFAVIAVPLVPQPAPASPPPPPLGISTLIESVTFNPAGRAVGSCDYDMFDPEWARVRINLPYFPNNGRLDMTGILDNLRTANATMWVQCHVQAGPNGALVEVATGNVELAGGQNLTTTFPPGFQNPFGLAVNDH